MKVTYNWLKDFVDIAISPAALAEKLTMAGIEVKAVVENSGDSVFEIEVTSNRPDWLNIAGLAREVSAITGKKLKKQPAVPLPLSKTSRQEQYSILIEDKKDCPVYTARIIEGVRVAPSPAWLKERLEMVGCRSVNNIVDITNYVLFEIGEPLHAFDAERLQGSCVAVRRARPAEKLITIDGQERNLSPDILVIADGKKPVALAGIMGGKDTEVAAATATVLLEAAIFNPLTVRRGRQRLGIQSEASYRFERSIDWASVDAASLRACAMIIEIAGGKLVQSKRSGTLKRAPQAISLAVDKASRVLGTDITPRQARSMLASLGFGVKALGSKGLKVTAPSYRADVKEDVDLIEEIARINGYTKIPTTLPGFIVQEAAVAASDPVRPIKKILASLGLDEVITHSIVNRGILDGLWHGEGEVLELENPLNKEQDILRPTLVPSLLGCVAYNLRQKQERIAIFEIAKTYARSGARLSEEYMLAIALCGEKKIWHSGGCIQDKPGLLHLKGVIESLFARLGITGYKLTWNEQGSIALFQADSALLGTLRILEPALLERFEIKNRGVFVAELAVAELLRHRRTSRRFIPLPRYPAMNRDVSVTVKDSVPAGTLRDAIMRHGGSLLEEAEIIDFYTGKQIENGFKNITFSCRYRSAERTLTEEEVNPVHRAVTEALVREFQARIR